MFAIGQCGIPGARLEVRRERVHRHAHSTSCRILVKLAFVDDRSHRGAAEERGIETSLAIETGLGGKIVDTVLDGRRISDALFRA